MSIDAAVSARLDSVDPHDCFVNTVYMFAGMAEDNEQLINLGKSIYRNIGIVERSPIGESRHSGAESPLPTVPTRLLDGYASVYSSALQTLQAESMEAIRARLNDDRFYSKSEQFFRDNEGYFAKYASEANARAMRSSMFAAKLDAAILDISETADQLDVARLTPLRISISDEEGNSDLAGSEFPPLEGSAVTTSTIPGAIFCIIVFVAIVLIF